MKKYIFFIAFCLFLFNQKIARVEGPSSEQILINHIHQIISAKKAFKIDSFFTARHKMRLFNGAVLFAEKGRVIYSNAFGYSNFKKKIPLEVNTAFQLASITKPLTSCAVLMLVESGKLDLNDDVRKYFPEFPYEDVTIRLLLSHRSGLPDYMYFADKLWKSRRIFLTNQDMSGLTFAEYLKQNIFDPLGMKNSFVYSKEKIKAAQGDELAIGYDHPRRRAENSYLNGIVGDKGIYSTVEDLFRWDQALYQGNLISLFTMEEAFTPAHRDLRDYDNYGFGWRINLNNGDKIVFHSGWWKGFKTYFIRKIEEQKTIIILTNTANQHFLSIRRLSALL